MSTHSVEQAAELARLFVEPLGRRWCHVQSVASSAGRLARSIGLDASVLVSAAWLHDIGYASQLHDTGFHPVDGARYLRRQGVDEHVVSLVAHHSCARVEAVVRGMAEEFAREFARPPAEYEDALCYCDMTNGPAGDRVEVVDRLDEIQLRYGSGHPVTRFVDSARDEILASVARVEERLAVSGSLESGR